MIVSLCLRDILFMFVFEFLCGFVCFRYSCLWL
jgi:hypothetical protein